MGEIKVCVEQGFFSNRYRYFDTGIVDVTYEPNHNTGSCSLSSYIGSPVTVRTKSGEIIRGYDATKQYQQRMINTSM
jgi:hypothetical protein